MNRLKKMADTTTSSSSCYYCNATAAIMLFWTMLLLATTTGHAFTTGRSTSTATITITITTTSSKKCPSEQQIRMSSTFVSNTNNYRNTNHTSYYNHTQEYLFLQSKLFQHRDAPHPTTAATTTTATTTAPSSSNNNDNAAATAAANDKKQHYRDPRFPCDATVARLNSLFEIDTTKLVTATNTNINTAGSTSSNGGGASVVGGTGTSTTTPGAAASASAAANFRSNPLLQGNSANQVISKATATTAAAAATTTRIFTPKTTTTKLPENRVVSTMTPSPTTATTTTSSSSSSAPATATDLSASLQRKEQEQDHQNEQQLRELLDGVILLSTTSSNDRSILSSSSSSSSCSQLQQQELNELVRDISHALRSHLPPTAPTTASITTRAKVAQELEEATREYMLATTMSVDSSSFDSNDNYTDNTITIIHEKKQRMEVLARQCRDMLQQQQQPTNTTDDDDDDDDKIYNDDTTTAATDSENTLKELQHRYTIIRYEIVASAAAAAAAAAAVPPAQEQPFQQQQQQQPPQMKIDEKEMISNTAVKQSITSPTTMLPVLEIPQFQDNGKPDPVILQQLLDDATLIYDRISSSSAHQQQHEHEQDAITVLARDLVCEIGHLLYYSTHDDDDDDHHDDDNNGNNSNGQHRSSKVIANELDGALQNLSKKMPSHDDQEYYQSLDRSVEELAAEYRAAKTFEAMNTRPTATTTAEEVITSLQERLQSLQREIVEFKDVTMDIPEVVTEDVFADKDATSSSSSSRDPVTASSYETKEPSYRRRQKNRQAKKDATTPLSNHIDEQRKASAIDVDVFAPKGLLPSDASPGANILNMSVQQADEYIQMFKDASDAIKAQQNKNNDIGSHRRPSLNTEEDDDNDISGIDLTDMTAAEMDEYIEMFNAASTSLEQESKQADTTDSTSEIPFSNINVLAAATSSINDGGAENDFTDMTEAEMDKYIEMFNKASLELEQQKMVTRDEITRKKVDAGMDPVFPSGKVDLGDYLGELDISGMSEQEIDDYIAMFNEASAEMMEAKDMDVEVPVMDTTASSSKGLLTPPAAPALHDAEPNLYDVDIMKGMTIEEMDQYIQMFNDASSSIVEQERLKQEGQAPIMEGDMISDIPSAPVDPVAKQQTNEFDIMQEMREEEIDQYIEMFHAASAEIKNGKRAKQEFNIMNDMTDEEMDQYIIMFNTASSEIKEQKKLAKQEKERKMARFDIMKEMTDKEMDEYIQMFHAASDLIKEEQTAPAEEGTTKEEFNIMKEMTEEEMDEYIEMFHAASAQIKEQNRLSQQDESPNKKVDVNAASTGVEEETKIPIDTNTPYGEVDTFNLTEKEMDEYIKMFDAASAAISEKNHASPVTEDLVKDEFAPSSAVVMEEDESLFEQLSSSSSRADDEQYMNDADDLPSMPEPVTAENPATIAFVNNRSRSLSSPMAPSAFRPTRSLLADTRVRALTAMLQKLNDSQVDVWFSPLFQTDVHQHIERVQRRRDTVRELWIATIDHLHSFSGSLQTKAQEVTDKTSIFISGLCDDKTMADDAPTSTDGSS